MKMTEKKQSTLKQINKIMEFEEHKEKNDVGGNRNNNKKGTEPWASRLAHKTLNLFLQAEGK